MPLFAPFAVDCSKPFSFYFELVSKFWKYTSTQYASLHRVCAIARSLEANSLVVEDAALFPHVDRELREIEGSGVRLGACEARAISFFRDKTGVELPHLSGENDGEEFIQRAQKDTENIGFLGQVILINCETPEAEHRGRSYIFEALLSPPKAMTLGDSRVLLESFQVNVLGRPFSVQAAYYCQQNGITSNCGHAAIRALMSRSGAPIATTEIDAMSGRAGFSSLMELAELATAIQRLGAARQERAVSLLPPQLPPQLPGEAPLTREDILTSLVTALESGVPAILTHTTSHVYEDGQQAAHVVAAVGYAIDRNLWHPQAVQAYNNAGPKPQSHDSAKWVRHLIVHDENFGPYRTLGIRSFPPLEEHQHALSQELPKDLTIAKRPSLVPSAAIGLLDIQAVMWPRALLTFARKVWEWVQEMEYPDLSEADNSQELITARDWGRVFFHNPREQVLRPIAVKRVDYLEHIQEFAENVKRERQPEGLSEAANLAAEIGKSLPGQADWFWMVELSHTLLYTGLDNKIGEFLTGDYPTDITDDDERVRSRWWIVRLPGLVLGVVDGVLVEFENLVKDHGPMYMAKRFPRAS